MANSSHLAKLKEGVEVWNQWRAQHPTIKPDLAEAELSRITLTGADLHNVNLRAALLTGTKLCKADLGEATLWGAQLFGADLRGADLRKADLTNALLLSANLSGADLRDAALNAANLNRANFEKADLRSAKLVSASLVRTSLAQADLSGAWVYGVSAWNVELNGAIQSNLIITPRDEPPIQVDNLEMAQFIYLLLNNERIRDVIDTITSKVVLIFGRFTNERKAVLDALREKLRAHDLAPVLFDFSKPTSKDLTGTIETLARMARFVVADLTDPSSIPHELATVVPFLRTTPVVLLRLAGTTGYGMVKDLEAYDRWVLPVREYPDSATLIDGLEDYVIQPAEARLRDLRPNNPPQ